MIDPEIHFFTVIRLGYNEKMRGLFIKPGSKYPQFEVIYYVFGVMTQPVMNVMRKGGDLCHFFVNECKPV